MKNEPVNIQLAIQGGAAKICVLVAALEAVQQLQTEGLLQVTRIAGTSAGAIVGVLFAAKIPMSTVKARLEGLELTKVVPNYSKLRLVTRFVRGEALWSDEGLQGVIQKLVDEAEPKVTTFADIEHHFGIPVQVLAADIRNGEARVYRENDQVVNSVLDSCAVPFGFRAAHSGGDASIVDGGICENLPSDLLVEHTSSFGPIVGISFRKPAGRAPDNVISFALALMDAAMNNSIQRAKKVLDGAIFEIDTTIGSFDWEQALGSGFKAEYDKVKHDADKFFRSFVQRIWQKREIARSEKQIEDEQRAAAEVKRKEEEGKIKSDVWTASQSGDQWAQRYQEAMCAAGSMFRVQHSTSKILFEYCQLIVTAWSLLDPREDNRAGDFDEIRHRAVLRTLDQPIYCHSIGLSHADHETLLLESDYVVIGPDQEEIKTIKLLMSDGTTNNRELLLSFDPILPPQTGPYQLRFVDRVKGFVRLLKDEKPDELVLTVRRAHETVKKVDLVLYAPKEYSTLRMVPKPVGLHVGRAMNDLELFPYKENTPWGLKAFGWVGENIPPGYRFGVDLYR